MNSAEELPPFVETHGVDGFPQLDDSAGSLWQQFGTSGRSTFMFINDDGGFELTTYGVVDEDELRNQVNRLIES